MVVVGIAKLVRHWILIPACVGSSPTTLTLYFGFMVGYICFYLLCFLLCVSILFFLYGVVILCLLNLDFVLFLKLFFPCCLSFCFLVLFFLFFYITNQLHYKSVLTLLALSRFRLRVWYVS